MFALLSNPTLTNVLIQFALGSSLLSTLPAIGIIGFNNNKYKMIRNYEYPAFVLPLLFGLFSVLAYYLQRFIRREVSYVLVGGALGILFSYLTKNSYRYPTKLLGIKTDNDYLLYLYSFLLFGGFFYLIVRPITLLK